MDDYWFILRFIDWWKTKELSIIFYDLLKEETLQTSDHIIGRDIRWIVEVNDDTTTINQTQRIKYIKLELIIKW